MSEIKIIAVLLALLASTSSALAQFELLQIAICKKITADSDRLKCFDAVGSKTQPSSDEPLPVKGRWVYTESKSPIDDSDQLVAMLGGEPEDALLVFRCMENKTEAIFVPPLGFFASGRADILVRVGSDAPMTISASVGTNNRALFISPAADFMRLLPDNARLFFRATGFQGKRADGLFTLADASVAREKVAQTCHWTAPKAAKAK